MMKKRNYRYGGLLLGCCLTLSVQAQNYGALQHMLQKRPANEKFQQNRFNDHLFFSAGMGVNSLLTERDLQLQPGLRADLYLGKWLTPAHGLRLGGSLGIHDLRGFITHVKMASLQADYLLNLSSLAFGYDVTRPFEVISVAGVEAGYSRATKLLPPADASAQATSERQHGLFGGIRWGLQANLRLSNTVDLFVEPRVGIYTEGVTRTESWRNYCLKGEVLVGLTYQPAASMGRHIHFDGFESKPLFQRMFVTAAAGASAFYSDFDQLDDVIGLEGAIGLGKWLSPSSGLRLMGSLGYHRLQRPEGLVHPKVATLRADYLWNVNSTLWGYNSERFFNLNTIVGVNLAAVKTANDPLRFVPGIGVGVQGAFRVSPAVELYVEPRANLYTSKYANGVGYRGMDQVGEVLFGVNYHWNRPANVTHRHFETADFKRRFASVAVGAASPFVSHRGIYKRAGYQVTASYGQWFTPLSAWRANLQWTDRVKSYRRGYLRYAGIGVDYLLSMGTLATGHRSERKVDVIPFIGATFGMSHVRKTDHWVPGVDFGAQFKFFLTPTFDLFVEPRAGFRSDKYDGSKNREAARVASVQTGLSYKF